jgi:hypothetical protein
MTMKKTFADRLPPRHWFVAISFLLAASERSGPLQCFDQGCARVTRLFVLIKHRSRVLNYGAEVPVEIGET